jgi:DNA integrity scanning protein DisA with diadenylate cyclase activity
MNNTKTVEDENKLEINLINSIAEKGMGEIIEDGVEISVDSFIENDLLREIPIVKTVVAISKGVLNVRDYLFLKKIITFLNEARKIEPEKRKKFAEEIKKNSRINEVGLKLTEIIDKSFGEYKAKIIGKLFVIFLEGGSMTQQDFFRLSEMTINAYESYLEYFFKKNEDEIGETGDEVEHLLAIGFYERGKQAFGHTIMEAKQPTFSSYGNMFNKVKKLL